MAHSLRGDSITPSSQSRILSKRFWSDQWAAAPLQEVANQWVVWKGRFHSNQLKNTFYPPAVIECRVSVFQPWTRSMLNFWAYMLAIARGRGGKVTPPPLNTTLFPRRSRIFKLLRTPGIDSTDSIPSVTSLCGHGASNTPAVSPKCHLYPSS